MLASEIKNLKEQLLLVLIHCHTHQFACVAKVDRPPMVYPQIERLLSAEVPVGATAPICINQGTVVLLVPRINAMNFGQIV